MSGASDVTSFSEGISYEVLTASPAAERSHRSFQTAHLMSFRSFQNESLVLIDLFRAQC